MRPILLILALPALLAACAAEPKWAPEAEVRKYAFSSGEPPSITLYTVISKETGAGGHSSLLVNASQRVLFDPAGTFEYPMTPERNDVHYGMTERMRKLYIDYHARERWFVRAQTLPVTPEVAEMVKARVEGYGAVKKSYCANSTSAVLSAVPGFEGIGSTMYPVKLSERFAQLPGVVTKDWYDDNPEIKTGITMVRPDETEVERPGF